MTSTLKSWGAILTFGLLALACAEQPSIPFLSPTQTEASATAVTFVGAGDIAGCALNYGDEATAELIRDIPGTVFTLGDNVYKEGTGAASSSAATILPGGSSRRAPGPLPATTT